MELIQKVLKISLLPITTSRPAHRRSPLKDHEWEGESKSEGNLSCCWM